MERMNTLDRHVLRLTNTLRAFSDSANMVQMPPYFKNTVNRKSIPAKRIKLDGRTYDKVRPAVRKCWALPAGDPKRIEILAKAKGVE